MKSIFELNRKGNIVKRLKSAIDEISNHAHSGNVTDNCFEKLDIIMDGAKTVDKEDLKRAVDEINKASKYAGYTNIQYDLIRDVDSILGL